MVLRYHQLGRQGNLRNSFMQDVQGNGSPPPRRGSIAVGVYSLDDLSMFPSRVGTRGCPVSHSG